MADTGRATQSFVIAGASAVGSARVTQSYIILAVGLGVICGNPPAGTVGVAYSHMFPAGGGDPPLSYLIVAGSLPPGLTLNGSTGAVTGTPSSAGSFPFTIQVTDSLGAISTVACSIGIAPLPSTSSVIISLYGWKLYPNVPCDDALPAVDLPPVKRAV